MAALITGSVDVWFYRLRLTIRPNETLEAASRCVLEKSCFENMQQIYRRTPMPKCDFNRFAKQLYWNHTSAWALSFKFAAYFQNTFS